LVGLQRAGRIGHQKVRDSLVAWLGHTQHADAYRLNQVILGRAGLLAD
jgi:hypothetical protein